MIVSVLSRKLVKPSIPTPPSKRRYHISFIDELVFHPNSPNIVLYYAHTSSSSSSNTEKRTLSILQSLEESLSKVLIHFHPLAGRYIHNERMVDCNDQGVEFIVAKASVDIKQLVDGTVTEQDLDHIHPRNAIHKMDIDVPVTAIQLTEFNCGGIAISLSVWHKFFDASALATFFTYWANSTNHKALTIDPPKWDAPQIFPPKNLPTTAQLETIPLKIVNKRLLFKQEALNALKSKHTTSQSKVRVATALITEALIRVEKKILGRSTDFIIYQVFNLRPKTVPPIPEHTCGNLLTVALTQRIAKNDTENRRYENLVGILGAAFQKKNEDCKKMLQSGEAAHAILMEPIVTLGEALSGGELTVYFFSDLSKFRFYDADFGWGKPIWTSLGNTLNPNGAVFMPEREGTGLEAWIHLDEKSMSVFEQDEQIKFYTTLPEKRFSERSKI